MILPISPPPTAPPTQHPPHSSPPTQHLPTHSPPHSAPHPLSSQYRFHSPLTHHHSAPRPSRLPLLVPPRRGQGHGCEGKSRGPWCSATQEPTNHPLPLVVAVVRCSLCETCLRCRWKLASMLLIRRREPPLERRLQLLSRSQGNTANISCLRARRSGAINLESSTSRPQEPGPPSCPATALLLKWGLIFHPNNSWLCQNNNINTPRFSA